MAIIPFDISKRAFIASLTKEEEAQLSKLPWHYGIPFSENFRITTLRDPSFRLHEYLLDQFNFAGKSVLHIGCRDGFFMFLAEALGAKNVRGIDDSPSDRKLRECFLAAKEVLRSESEILTGDVEKLSPEIDGTYDIVILSDVLTKSECPKRILEKACKLCKEDLLFITHYSTDEDKLPYLRSYPSFSNRKEFRDLYAPNLSWIRYELEANGFQAGHGLKWEANNTLTLSAKRFTPFKKLNWNELQLDTGMEDQTAFLVISCSRYNQAWEPFFTLLFKYWPDCPYKIYFLTDTGTYKHPKVIPLEIGKDLGWSGNFKYALEKITASRIIFTLEDFFPTAPWNNERIRKLVRHAHDVDAGVLRLFPCPGPSGEWYASDAIGTIGATDDYRISTMNSIWKKSMLNELIQDGMSAWDFELKGSVNSATRLEPFLSTWEKDECVMPYYATGITKGKWEPNAIELLRKEGIPTDHIRLKV